MKYISSAQLSGALKALAAFREKVNPQGVQHILPFLALKRKGVNTRAFKKYTEADDKAFFNKFARVKEGETPYFDPIKSSYRIETHPHSNVSTARKGTFSRSWGAADFKEDPTTHEELFKLSADYLELLQKKAITKAGKKTRVPAIALAAFLFRHRQFPDSYAVGGLGKEIKAEFRLSDEEYNALFEESTRLPEFADEPISAEEVISTIEASGVVEGGAEARTEFQELLIQADDKILAQVKALLFEDKYAGVIFVGPPGTSKSWYAVQVALSLADGDATRIKKIQFHKSYQYENFVQGYFPTEDGKGFELRDQLMLDAIRDANNDSDAIQVVLIDELSRSDPGRVFGELLTYIEPTRRNEEFLLASGRPLSVPLNLVFIATMNSRDKSVVEIDDAFERRMAKIEFAPNAAILEARFRETGVDEKFAGRVVGFFNWIQQKYPLGHTFLFNVRDGTSFKRVWDTQLRFVFEKQFKYEPHEVAEIRQKCIEIVGVEL